MQTNAQSSRGAWTREWARRQEDVTAEGRELTRGGGGKGGTRESGRGEDGQ